MKKNVLFIQGGGEGAYESDKKLAASLQELLGSEYQVHYPMMPNEADPEYETYKTQIAKEFASLDSQIALVGHSIGGTVLLRFLTEEKVEKPIVGIFLVAAPIGLLKIGLTSTSCTKILFHHPIKLPPFSFTIVVMILWSRLHIWRCMRPNFPKQPFMNSMAEGISFTTIYRKLPQIS